MKSARDGHPFGRRIQEGCVLVAEIVGLAAQLHELPEAELADAVRHIREIYASFDSLLKAYPLLRAISASGGRLVVVGRPRDVEMPAIVITPPHEKHAKKGGAERAPQSAGRGQRGKEKHPREGLSTSPPPPAAFQPWLAERQNRLRSALPLSFSDSTVSKIKKHMQSEQREEAKKKTQQAHRTRRKEKRQRNLYSIREDEQNDEDPRHSLERSQSDIPWDSPFHSSLGTILEEGTSACAGKPASAPLLRKKKLAPQPKKPHKKQKQRSEADLSPEPFALRRSEDDVSDLSPALASKLALVDQDDEHRAKGDDAKMESVNKKHNVRQEGGGGRARFGAGRIHESIDEEEEGEEEEMDRFLNPSASWVSRWRKEWGKRPAGTKDDEGQDVDNDDDDDDGEEEDDQDAEEDIESDSEDDEDEHGEAASDVDSVAIPPPPNLQQQQLSPESDSSTARDNNQQTPLEQMLEFALTAQGRVKTLAAQFARAQKNLRTSGGGIPTRARTPSPVATSPSTSKTRPVPLGQLNKSQSAPDLESFKRPSLSATVATAAPSSPSSTLSLASPAAGQSHQRLALRMGVDCGSLVLGSVPPFNNVDVWGAPLDEAHELQQRCDAGKIAVSDKVRRAMERKFAFAQCSAPGECEREDAMGGGGSASSSPLSSPTTTPTGGGGLPANAHTRRALDDRQRATAAGGSGGGRYSHPLCDQFYYMEGYKRHDAGEREDRA